MAAEVICHALTHTGAVRAHNEDAIAVNGWRPGRADLTRPARRRVVIDGGVTMGVADGMGGHPGGDVASRAAVDFVLAHADSLRDAAAARGVLEAANGHLHALMKEGAGPPGMGTTLAGLALWPEGGVVFNVGDSRVYAVSAEGTPHQISTDDTPGLRSTDGRVALETTPIVSQCLGGQRTPAPLAPHAEALPAPTPGARYLLCSDGLSDRVSRAHIGAILAREADGPAVEALFEAALAAGGADNVSILLARVVPLGDPVGDTVGDPADSGERGGET